MTAEQGECSNGAKAVGAPFPVPDEAFMILELAPHALNEVQGPVEYPPAFDDA